MGARVGGSGGSGGGATAGQIRAGGAFLELSLDDAKLRKGLTAAGRLIDRTGARATAVTLAAAKLPPAVLGAAGKALSGLGAFSAKLGAGLLGASAVGLVGINQALGRLSELGNLSNVARGLGLTTQSLQRLQAGFASAGLDGDAVADLLTDMNDKLIDAATGAAAAAEDFELLGVNAKALAGLPLDKQFAAVADAVARIEDPARASGLVVRLFSDNGLRLLPILRQGSEGFKQLGDRAERLGLVQTAEQMADVTAAQKAMADASLTVKGAFQEAAAALAPSVQQAAGFAATALGPLGRWVRGNHRLVVTLAGVVVGAGAAGVALLALGAVLSAAGSVLGTVAAAAAVVASPIGLAAAAVAGLGGWFLTSTDRGKGLAAALTGKLAAGFESFAATAKTTWGGVADALKAGDLALAGEVALAGRNVEFVKWTAELLKVWAKFKADLMIGSNVLSEALGLPDIKKDLEALGKAGNAGGPKVNDPGYFIDPSNTGKTGSWFDFSRFRVDAFADIKREAREAKAKREAETTGKPGEPVPPPEYGDTKRSGEQAVAHFFNALTRPFITGDEYRQRRKNIDEDFAAASRAAGDRLRQGVQAVRDGAAAERKQILEDAQGKLDAAEAKLAAKIEAAAKAAAAVTRLTNAKAAGEKLTGPALVGLGFAGPLAQLAAAGALNGAGLKLPDLKLEPPDKPDRDKQFADTATGIRSASIRNGSAATFGQAFGYGDKTPIRDLKKTAEATKKAIEDGNKLTARTNEILDKAGPLVWA